MDHRAQLIAAFALLAVSSQGWAAYASPTPPPGFGLGPSGSTYAAAAADAIANARATSAIRASLSIGGQPTTMQVTYRYAASAAKVAARIAFKSPLGVGLAVILWAANSGFKVQDGKWVRTVEPVDPDPQVIPSDGFEYAVDFMADVPTVLFYPTRQLACEAAAGRAPARAGAAGYKFTFKDLTNTDPPTCRYTFVYDDGQTYHAQTGVPFKRPSTCPAGWYKTAAGCVQDLPKPPTVPVTEEEFVDKVGGGTMPDAVPQALPKESPLPVQYPPILNPDPTGNPQPLRVPMGSPQPVPNTNPVQWRQPVTDIVHSPTQNDPHRVELAPRTTPTPTETPPATPNNPNPQPVPVPITEPTPVTPTPNPQPANPSDPKTEERDPGLCEEYPDIVACQKLGSLGEQPLQTKTVDMAMKTESGFGPANGSCPAPKTFMVLGKQMAFRWDLLCDFANAIRPLLIGFAYLSAALAFMGLSRKEA